MSFWRVVVDRNLLAWTPGIDAHGAPGGIVIPTRSEQLKILD